MIIGNLCKAVNTKGFLNFRKIILKQIFDGCKIISRKMVDTSIVCTDFFTGDAERIFICNKEVSQIIVPQIFIKSEICCYRQQTFDLCIHLADQHRVALGALLKFPENLTHLV